MSKKRAVALVDVRVLDNPTSAEYIKELEKKNIHLVFCAQDPDELSGLSDCGYTTVSNTGKLPPHRFWRKAYEMLSDYNEVVAVVGLRRSTLMREAENQHVAFSVQYCEDSRQMVIA